MKKIFLLFVVHSVVVVSCFAQFDEKFYSPSRDWYPIENIDYDEIVFKVENDTINTILFKTLSAPKATIVYYHGATGNISHNVSLAKLLVENDFQVFMIDFRGYGKSTGKPTHVNIASDAQLVFDNILKMEEIKDRPIILYGASLGTQIAAKMAADNKDKISALILEGTMRSFTDLALLSVPDSQKEMISMYVTSPYSAMEDIKKLDSVPKLFIHAVDDKIVPFSQGKDVFLNAPEPKAFWEYNGNHLDAAIYFPKELIQKINSL